MPKKNAFFWFMLEHKKRLESKGQRFRSLQDVAPLAGKIWEKMDAKERERYASADVKQKPRTAGHPKPASAHNNQKTKADQKKSNETGKGEQSMPAMLKKRLHRAEMDDTIEQLDFYIISMEYFCVTDDGVYVPAELGVIRYSLECGVREQLHLLLNPGKLPYGFALQMQQHAAMNHALPLPPDALGETNFDTVASQLLAFLVPEDDASLPMLFTAANGARAVESMVRRLLGDRIGQQTLHVCNVAELLYRLKLSVEFHMMSVTLFPSLEMAQQIIDGDTFAYTPKISCEYHESQDLLDHCALSRCIRWAYTISQNCCNELGIDLIPGKHVPIDTIVDPVPHLPDAADDDGGDTVLPNQHLGRFNDAIVEPSFSGNNRQQLAPSPVERSKRGPDLDELLEQQRNGEGNVKRISIRDPQVLDDDEIARGVIIKVIECESFNVRGPGRGRGIMRDEYPHPAVMGRSTNHLRRGGHYPAARGRGFNAPLRGRGR